MNIHAILAKFVGLKISRLTPGVDSALVLELEGRAGETLPRDWLILIERSAWRLHHGQDILTGDHSNHGTLTYRRELAKLNGATIVSIDCKGIFHDLTLTFSTGHILETFCVTDADRPHYTEAWVFLLGDGYKLTSGPGVKLDYSPRGED